MTGVVLAAGRGSRLSPLTERTPKPLILLPDGTRLIDRALAPLLQRCKRIVVVTGYRSKDVMYYLNHKDYKKVTCVTVPEVVRGNLFSLMEAREYAQDDSLIVTNADHVFGKEIMEFIAMDHEGLSVGCQSKGSRQIGVDEMKVIVDPDGRLIDISKTLEVYDGAYVGIFKVSYEMSGVFWEVASRLCDSDGADAMVVEDIFREMIKGDNHPRVIWIDHVRFYEVDTFEDLEVLKDAVQGGDI